MKQRIELNVNGQKYEVFAEPNAMMAEKFGLTVENYRQENDYAAAPQDIDVERLNVHIPKGTLCDYISRDILTTKDGAELWAQSHYKFGVPGETNSFTVTVEGEPNFRMSGRSATSRSLRGRSAGRTTRRAMPRCAGA